MGFMDKLKNIFFEEEEEEEITEAPPKKEKEVIAKKVEIPKRKKEVVEIKPVLPKEEKEIEVERPRVVEEKKENVKINTDLIFDDDDFIIDTKKTPKKEEDFYTRKSESTIYKTRENRELYKKEEVRPRETTKYEYGSNKPKTEGKTFTPSPIISPIYGIRDKNYKKEEVKEKKEIRISSRPIKMDLDSVRNKAFGDLEYELFDNTPSKEDLEEKEIQKEIPKREIKKIYDMSKVSKPAIEKVTLGEADDYFNDLGLAYNTDYKDISKDINDGKVSLKEEKGDKLEDNLFDLIESMYDKED